MSFLENSYDGGYKRYSCECLDGFRGISFFYQCAFKQKSILMIAEIHHHHCHLFLFLILQSSLNLVWFETSLRDEIFLSSSSSKSFLLQVVFGLSGFFFHWGCHVMAWLINKIEFRLFHGKSNLPPPFLKKNIYKPAWL